VKGTLKRYIDWGIASAVFTVLLRALILFCAHRAETNWLFEVDLRSSETSRADLLYDEGQGFNAVSNQYVSGDDKYRTLSFPIPSRTIRAFRFDPLDGAGRFALKNAHFRNRLTGEIREMPIRTFAPQAQIETFKLDDSEIEASTVPNATDPMLSFRLDSPFEAGRPWMSFVKESLPCGAATVLIFSILSLLFRKHNDRAAIVAIAVSVTAGVVFFPEFLRWQAHPASQAHVQLRAPGSEIVRMKLCPNVGRSCNYSIPIELRPQPDKNETEWNFSIEVTGMKDPASLDSQVRIVEIGTPERLVKSWSDLGGSEYWKQILTMGRVGPEGKTGISSVPTILTGSIKGSRLTIKLLGGLTGGIAEVIVNGRTEHVNLYSELPEEMFTVEFSPLQPLNDQIHEYTTTLPSVEFERVRFEADNGPVEVKALSIEPYEFVPDDHGNLQVTLNATKVGFLAAAWSAAIASLLGTIILVAASGSIQSFSVLLSLYLAAFSWFVFSPGVMDADAVQQWAAGASGIYYTWHAPSFSMLMGAVQWFSSTPAPLCFAGAFIFWLSIFLLIGELCRPRPISIALSLAMIFVPPLWKYSGSVTNSVWASASFLFCIYFALRSYRLDSLKYFFLSALFLLGAILCRHNYLSVLPMLFVLLLVRFRSEIGTGKVVGLSVGLLVLAWAVPRTVEHLPNVEQKPYSFGHLLLNQYLGAVHSLPRDSADWAKEQRLVDGEMGQGTLDRLLSEYRCEDYYTYFAKYHIITNEELVKHSPFIIKNVLRSIVEYPRAAFEHKLCWTLAFLNLDKRRYGDLVMVEANPFGLTLIPKLPRMFSVVRWYLDLAENGAWYQTGVFFLVSMLVGLIAAILGRVDLGWVSAFSLFHVLGYFITDVCGCWRYLLPNYVLAMIIIGAAAAAVLPKRDTAHER